MSMPTTSSAALLVTAYRDFCRKALINQRLDESNAVVQHAHAARLYGASRKQRFLLDRRRSFRRLRQLLDLNFGDLFAYPTKPTTITAAPTAQQHAASAQHASEMQKLYGKDGLLRASLLYVLATASRAFMQVLNTTTVHGTEILEQAMSRPSGQALITVSNHVAAADDPLVLSTLLPQQIFTEPDKIRWTLCATDRCFRSAAMVPFFRAAKVLPVQRGAGMHQPGLQAAEQKLREGDWVHIFPEGTRSKDGSLGPVRKGVGRLIAACETPPLVVPFVHKGMEEVMPRGAVVPKVGQQVEVLVGEPVEVADLMLAAGREGWAEDELYTALAGRVALHLRVLRARMDGVELDVSVLREEGLVSGLELYDLTEPRVGLWERFKFRMQGVVGVGGVGGAGGLGFGGAVEVMGEGDATRGEGDVGRGEWGWLTEGVAGAGWAGRWREGRWREYWRECSDEVVQLLKVADPAV